MFKELESVPLFKDVDEYILHSARTVVRAVSCPTGTMIFEQGEPAIYLYLILTGVVEVLYKPYDGPTISITSLSQGGIIGWSAVVGNATIHQARFARKTAGRSV
jgi:CRP-like cAMP-binding protein